MFSGDRRTKFLTLGVMCFALFMAMLDNTVVNVALPNIQNHLGSGVSGLQWVISGYTLLFASLMLTGGTLGDIYGRRLETEFLRHLRPEHKFGSKEALQRQILQDIRIARKYFVKRKS